MNLRIPAGAVLGLLLAGCGNAPTATGPVVLPPPAGAQAEPSPLNQPRINLDHVHAIATRDGGRHLLLATHNGVRRATPGGGQRGPTEVGLKGDVLALFYVGNEVIAGGHNLGVKVSHDDGSTWADASPDLAGSDVHGLAADPSTPGRLYAYAVGKGLMVSEDSGAHWAHRAGEADTNYITGITVTADGTLLAGTPGRGIAASTDRGTSYVVVRSGTGPVYSVASSPTDAGVVLVAAEQGIFLTGDGGKTWNAGGTNVAVTSVAIDPADTHHFWAGASDGSIAESTDAGISWKPY
ncbi:MAG: hypothetical protein ABR573_03465 [Candidatus Dormibacteria bacterium]